MQNVEWQDRVSSADVANRCGEDLETRTQQGKTLMVWTCIESRGDTVVGVLERLEIQGM